MVISAPIIFGIVIGFIAGFFFSLWILDKLYKSSFKEYTEEMDKQYLYLLEKKGFKTKKDAM